MRHWKHRLVLVLLLIVAYLMIRTITVRLAETSNMLIADIVMAVVSVIILFWRSGKKGF